MDDKTIFKKAVEKAMKNGFNIMPYLPTFFPIEKEIAECLEPKVWTLLYGIKEKIIFSHSFCKMFWGEEKVVPDPLTIDITNKKKISDKDLVKIVQGLYEVPNWQHHLQIMILEKERIKYLKKYL